MTALKSCLQALRGLFVCTSKATVAVTASAIIIATPFVAQWESIVTKPYADQLAGGLMTVCGGETRVEMREYTEQECLDMLVDALENNLTVVRSSVTVPTSPKIDAAMVSFIHNVGEGAFKRSTLLRRMNNGEYSAACNELTRWVYAGGKRVQGLANRREAEKDLCLEGVNDL